MRTEEEMKSKLQELKNLQVQILYAGQPYEKTESKIETVDLLVNLLKWVLNEKE